MSSAFLLSGIRLWLCLFVCLLNYIQSVSHSHANSLKHKLDKIAKTFLPLIAIGNPPIVIMAFKSIALGMWLLHTINTPLVKNLSDVIHLVSAFSQVFWKDDHAHEWKNLKRRFVNHDLVCFLRWHLDQTHQIAYLSNSICYNLKILCGFKHLIFRSRERTFTLFTMIIFQLICHEGFEHQFHQDIANLFTFFMICLLT